jgi:hypothetical protein
MASAGRVKIQSNRLRGVGDLVSKLDILMTNPGVL